jgi:3-oxoacyl-[acyl-carrier-protein] synthase I
MGEDAPPDAVIVGVGMMTPVGLSADETAASVRAGIMRFEATSLFDRRFQPFTLAQVPDAGLPDLVDRPGANGITAWSERLLRLAAAPLRECTASLPAELLPLPIVLSLPEVEAPELTPESFLAALSAQVPGLLDPNRGAAPFRGRAGGIAAVGRAADVIRAGQIEFAIAGGVDSYNDADALAALDREGRVKSESNLDGFIPGEGAGFVLLASSAAARLAGLAPLATVAGWSFATEPGHLYSAAAYRGDGLATAIRQATAAAHAALPIRDAYASMNGESHWAKEWGVGYIRNQRVFAPDHGMHHPADSYGDPGAAAGPLMVGLAAMATATGERAGSALVYGSSDRGERAAIVISP